MRPICRITPGALPALLLAASLSGFASASASAQENVTLQLSVKDRQFQPSELQAPAGKRIVLRIKNEDAKPMEFESVALKVEKVIAGNSEGIVNIRPLQPGRYKFLDDFNKANQGTLVVQ
jgi:hypothetical protein